MISRKHFPLEYVQHFPINVVLTLSPCRPIFLILQSPVAREYGRQHLELVASHKHFVRLGVPSEAVAQKALVVHWHQIGAHVKRFVQKFEIGDIVGDSRLFGVLHI